MNKYYDPNFYYTNEKFSNIILLVAKMKDLVDGECLKKAVNSLRKRFPYFFVGLHITDKEYEVVSNPNPIIVRNTWKNTSIGSKENNYHLVAIKYYDNRIGLEVSHSLTDGQGIMPFMKAILYYYVCEKEKIKLDSTNIRVIGSEIPESEIGTPYPEEEVNSIEKPFYQKPKVDFYKINESHNKNDNNATYYCIKVKENDIMKYCKENDGSPNVIVSTLLARSIRKLDTETQKAITAGVAISHKAMLGNRNNYRMTASTVDVKYTKDRENADISTLNTLARAQIMLQAQIENSLFYAKMLKQGFEKMSQIPTLQMKKDLMKDVALTPRTTFAVSYIGERSFEAVNPYIEEFYVVVEPTTSDIVCEISCFDGYFYLSIMQSFSSQVYVQEFMNELKELNIFYEFKGKEGLEVSSVNYEEMQVV